MSKKATTMALMLMSMLGLANSSGILPAYGLWPQQDFLFDMCAPNRGEQKGPWPVRVNDLCTSFGLNNPQKREDACEVVQLLKMMLASPAAAPLRCQPGAIIPPPEQDRDGVLLPLPLPDLRGSGSIPEAFTPDQTAAILRTEGPTHLWLYKHVQRLQTWTPCEAIGKPQPWVQPPGWQLLRIFNVTNNLKAYKVDATSLPFAAVLRQASTPSSRAACRRALHEQRQDHQVYMTPPTPTPTPSSRSSSDGASVLQQHRLCGGDRLVVLLRGTSSAFEWTYNLNYTMGPDASYGLGQIHTGFHTVAEEVWGAGLQALLMQEVGQAGGVSNIIFSGHSLGGAVAALLAAKTQKYLADTLQSPAAATPAAVGDTSASTHSPLLTAVTFGAPNVGNAAFAADFNSRINARSIEYVADIVPQLPCAGHMPLCGPLAFSGVHSADAAADGGMEGSTDEEVDDAEAGLDSSSSSSSSTSSGGSSEPSVSYAMLGARVQLEATNMPLQQDAWKQLSIYRQDDFCDNLATINALAEATHSCSYMCHLSAAAGQDNTWCMLWPAEGGHWAANATYCQHGRSSLYPLSPPFPPMM